MLYETQPVVKG